MFGAAGIVFAATVVGVALRRAHWTGLAAATVVYAALVAYLRGLPDEVVHLAEYGGLGLLVRFALDTAPGAAKSAVAIVLTAALGFLDEWTQGATPGRFFDWRDVVVNTVAAAVPVLLLAPGGKGRGKPGATRSVASGMTTAIGGAQPPSGEHRTGPMR